MPEIAITAAITNGEALLFEEPEPGRLRLPRCPFTREFDEIEAALAAYLRGRFGLEDVQQDFIETLFERDADGAVVVNNLQLVTAWRGDPPAHVDAGSVPLRWVPLAELPGIDLPGDLRSVLLQALGLQLFDEGDAAAGTGGLHPGRVLILTGTNADGLRRVAEHLPAALGRCALIEIAAVRGMIRLGPRDTTTPGFAALLRHLHELSLQQTALLAATAAAAGIDAAVVGCLAGPEELDRLIAALLGNELYVVTLAAPGEPADPRGLRIDATAADPAATAARIATRLDAARVA